MILLYFAILQIWESVECIQTYFHDKAYSEAVFKLHCFIKFLSSLHSYSSYEVVDLFKQVPDITIIDKKQYSSGYRST
jgi:hypothetical protein